MLADITHDGSWYIGILVAPDIPEMLFAVRERTFLAESAFPALCATPGAFTNVDIDEFVQASQVNHKTMKDGWEHRCPA